MVYMNACCKRSRLLREDSGVRVRWEVMWTKKRRNRDVGAGVEETCNGTEGEGCKLMGEV